MKDESQLLAFDGGALVAQSGAVAPGEAVLAVPLARLVTALVKVPVESAADPVSVAKPLIEARNPFPDTPLSVACETLRETPSGELVVLAAALPEDNAEDIGAALDAAKVNLTRIDAIALGALESVKPSLNAGDLARRLVLIGDDAGSVDAFVVDGGDICALRSVAPGADLKCAAMLLLLEAEDFAGAKQLAEIVTSGEIAGVDALSAFATVRSAVRSGTALDSAFRGLETRAGEAASLNALPDSWREMLVETRFAAKLKKHLLVAGIVWVLVMAVLFGVPIAYGFMTDHQKQLCAEHKRAFVAVKEMKDKVELVSKYSDHERGALEIMKAISDRVPGGITLTSWNFRRDEGVKFSGEADTADLVYQFKDALVAIALVADDGGEGGDDGDAADSVLFGSVELNGPTASKGGRQKFDITCSYKSGEEEDE